MNQAQITESQIQAYELKKTQLENQVQIFQRDKIISEEQLNQQNAILMQTFNTTDPMELAKIAENYQTEITKLEDELRVLEQTI
jgi:hypothetical protein